jgi:thiol:disulfide interchange protein DsbD
LFFGHGLRAATHALYGSAPTRAAQAEIPWIASEEEAAALARARRQPMLLDFWATWCAPCKVLEEKLLRHPDVVAEARRFTAAKVDCTKEDERIRALYRKYGVAGLPALVFAGADGRVRGDLTVKELMPVEDFVARMRQVR